MTHTSRRKSNRAKLPAIVGSLLGVPAALLLAGLLVQPAPFPPVPQGRGVEETIPIPAGLPAPVERMYRVTYGARVPVVHTAVLSGRGTMRINGITFPVRCRFIHDAARNFRAYFELTVFGQPVIKADEHYLNGKFRQELPFGVEEGEPKIDHSAALRMWAEWALWVPAMLLTDPDARWEPVDDSTAVLAVPVGDSVERLVARFDETSGKMQYIEAMKYKGPQDAAKTLWVNAIWLGDKPWATFAIENTVYNTEVDMSLSRKGP